MRIVPVSVFTLMLLPLVVSAQSSASHDTSSGVTMITAEDSSRAINRTLLVKTGDTLSSSKSPGVALALSAVLPGAGQFYNESYWKIPILVGFGYYFATRWIDNNDSVKHYRSLYATSVIEQPPNGLDTYRRLRDFYKDQRNTFSWYIFIYYIVNLVDAYVDASLYDFNVGDDLSIHLVPDFNMYRPSEARVKVSIHF